MKFLESPMQTMGVGFALAVVLIMGYLGMTGMAVGDADWFGLLLRWTHFLAGIVWIGLLYFFNLINAAFLKQLRCLPGLCCTSTCIKEVEPARSRWESAGYWASS
jgi:hypothetical protein